MYSIEQLVEKTGYSKTTLYNLSVGLEIRPIRGKIQGKTGKGLYSDFDLHKLVSYKELIQQGKTKEEAYAEVLSYRP
jgi:hypothetical protein